MSSAYDKLKPHLQRFVDLYVMGQKGAPAVRAINPRIKAPSVAAVNWHRRPHVQDAIAERTALVKERAILSQEKWDQAIADIAFVKHAKAKIKPEHSVRALELGGRRLGLYKDSAGERTPVGPGLTVVVQQVVQTSAPAAPVATAGQRVDMRLPGPRAA